MQDHLNRLVEYYAINVIILAESRIPPSTLLKDLNRYRATKFVLSEGLPENIHVYVDFRPIQMLPISESSRYSIRSLKFPITSEYLVVIAHLPSKLYKDPRDQTLYAENLSDMIRKIENDRGHRRTIAVGDFNMNPFEDGMMQVNAFNSVSSQRIARDNGGYRVYGGKAYPFFYNPMWNFLGDRTRFKPGTYYYNSGRAVNFYWHMFDQVLVRPSLVDRLNFESLRIIDFDGEKSLITQNDRPDRRISDHLPITFQLDLEVI